MRVLLINRWYPIGGVGNYIRILSSALADLGHSVKVITAAQPDGQSKVTHDDRITVHSIPYPAVPYSLRRLPVTRAHYRAVETVLYAWRVERTRRKLERDTGEFDIVEYAEVNAEGLFHPPKATPYVVTLHTPTFVFDQVLPGTFGYSTWWISRWEQSFIRRADGIMSPSRDLATRVADFCDLDVSETRIIVNPIDTSELQPTDARSISDRVNVVYLGYLDARKGAFLMAEAVPLIVRRYPRVRITFVGHERTLPGGQKASTRIREIVGAAFATHIDIVGGVAHSDMIRIIQSADICVTPSVYENCPYAALETMACGRPLVATRNSGFVEMVKDGETGLLFEPGSAKDLADKVLRFANDRTYENETGQKAYEWVQANYAAPLVAQRKLEFYKRVIGSQSDGIL